MKKELLSITDKAFLSVILLVAALLRFWNLSSVPFMHDEFSALSRTCYETFSELIHQGIKIDGHPAGTQVLLYYMVKILGWNELWLKIPFALMGVASVFLTFKIGQQWFNTNVGLISAAFITVSELFVFYSQLIRPYSSGLFCVLLFVYYWNRILFTDERPSFKICLGFALSAFLCSQMHNFSLAQAGLIYIAGLLFLKKDNKSQVYAYFLSGLAALILFLPTSFIFYHQLFVNGGIGGWLPMPETSFIIDFLKYALNYSQLFIFGFIIIIAYPFLSNMAIDKTKSKVLLRIIGIALFVIPLVLAFVYSKLKEPILQFSTLIFSFPFFVIALLSFYDNKNINTIRKTAVIGSILFVGITSLIFDRQYYKQVYNQGYDSMAAEMRKDMDFYADSISFISFSNRSMMTKFYQDKEGISNNMLFDKNYNIYDYQDYLSTLDSKYIGVGIADYGVMSLEMTTLMFYPNVIKECQWFNTKYLLLSKEKNNNEMILMKSDETINNGYEWGCSFEMKLDTTDKIDDIGFIAEIQSVDTLKNIIFIMEIKDERNDSTLHWIGNDIKGNVFLPNKKYYMSNCFHYDDKKYDKNNVKIKVYIWNRDRKIVNIDRIYFYNSKKSSYFSGLYKPLK